MSRRAFLVPAAAAALTVIALLGLLWWQLPEVRTQLAQVLPTVNTPDIIQPESLTNLSGDDALLALRKGDILALRGDWSAAAESYEKAVQANGGLPAYQKLATAQLQKRDLRGARVTLENMRRKGARDEDLLLLESVIDLRSGELQRAQQLLSNAKDSPQKSYGLALLAIMQGDHDTAKIHLQLTIAGWEPVLRSFARTIHGAYDEYALFPESPTLHLQALLARALAQVQECEIALPLLSAVTQQQNDYRDAWTVRGYCELTTERFAEALASLERAYQLDPEKPEIQYFLARTYVKLGDHNNAITFLQYALQNRFEPQSEVRRTLAEGALIAGNTALALEQADAITQLEDATIDTYADFVSISIRANQKESAYIKAQEAVQKWPNTTGAYLLLGQAALETGRKEEARNALSKALEIDPNNGAAKEMMKKL